MLKARSLPSVAYLDGAVYVASWDEASMEMLSLPNNQPGQWTLILLKNLPFGWCADAVCAFKGRIFITGELEGTH